MPSPPPGLPTELAERVLDLVATIPAGRVMTYGDVAAAVGSGPRAVGTVMSRYGGGVPWHRVVRADGRPAAGHEVEAGRLLRGEGIAFRGDRVDLASARWSPPGRRAGPD
ncbi:MAG: MGMT family protein [Candidatus Nanopelagicales bacterium]